MGLASEVVERLAPEAISAHRDLLALHSEALAQTTEDATAPLERRWLAGQILAIVGDPRIDVFEPALIDLPGGVATVGLPADDVEAVVERWWHAGVEESWIRKEVPRHEVVVQPFRMMKYPITNLEYRAFCLDVPEAPRPTSWRFGIFPLPCSNHPAWTVPPDGADGYAFWLSERTGRRFRLPSEVEWEYAANGGELREFPWGNEWDPHCTNTVEEGPLFVTPVGMFPAGASVHGVLDLGGNVEEWVADEYRPYEGGELVVDDLIARVGRYRVTRGGCYTRFGDLARCSRRHGWYGRELYAVGFRLVEDVDAATVGTRREEP